MATLDLGAVSVLSDSSEGPLPLKIRAKGDNNSVGFLKDWVATNKDWLDQKLLEHGNSPSHFSCIICDCSSLGIEPMSSNLLATTLNH